MVEEGFEIGGPNLQGDSHYWTGYECCIALLRIPVAYYGLKAPCQRLHVNDAT